MAKINLVNGLWKGALSAARDVSIASATPDHELTCGSKFKVPRITIYRTLCEGLETVEGITDAIECFHQMENELPEGAITQGGQVQWVLGEQSCIPCRWRL